jgi:hypothetical protein
MMGNQTEGDVLNVDPTEYSLEELYDILAGRSQRLLPVVALSALRRKSYPEERKVADLRRILLDDEASSRLRTAAAVELARLGTPAARNVLLVEVEAKDEVMRRSVQIGQRELARLHGWAVPAPKERREVLSTPQGVMARETGPILGINAERAQPITKRKADPATAERIVSDLNAETPGLALADDMAYTVRCAGRTLAFVAAQGIAALIRTAEAPTEPIVVGVVAVRETVETGKWTAHFYLLAGRGEKDGEFVLRVVATTGQVVMVGTGRLVDGRADFSLRSVAGPGNAPAEVNGSYRAGRMQWTEARSETQVVQQHTPGRRQ